ncbi:MAG: FliH/SctL family protein [bacterium]
MSKVIPGDAEVDVKPWYIPDVNTLSSDDPDVFTPNTQSQDSETSRVEREQEEYNSQYNQGFEQGYADGKQAADEELARKSQQLDTLLDFLAKPVTQVEQRVEQELLELSLAVARQILRREISIDPKHIIGLIRSAVGRLPAAENEVIVSLNPDDARVIRKALKESSNKQRWKIVEDPGLDPGSCNINSENSYIDGSVDAMVNQISLDLFGGQRDIDRTRGKESEDSGPSPTAPEATVAKATKKKTGKKNSKDDDR